jgi:hypothetical protein
MFVTYENVSLDWWGWAIIVLVCLSPLLGYLWHVWRNNKTTPVEARQGTDSSLTLVSR